MFLRVVRSSICAIFSILLVPPTAASAAADLEGLSTAPACQVAGALVRVAELVEGSGVAASKRSPGRVWAHNDSGEPVLVALDAKGTVTGRVRVPGAKVEDWEAIAVGPCPSGDCIYVGDIGDNDAERRDITIHRFPEPADASGSVSGADVIRARYPDGSHDAETLLVTPKGDILIVTKGRTGRVALYRFPSDAKPGATVTLQSIGEPRQGGKTADDRITDGAVSPSGAWVALRTNTAILFYRTPDLMSGNWREAGRLSLKELAEPQGEGIAFGDEKTIYLVGEGGGKSQPGTFGRLTCAPGAN
jgi:hypothetical protein